MRLITKEKECSRRGTEPVTEWGTGQAGGGSFHRKRHPWIMGSMEVDPASGRRKEFFCHRSDIVIVRFCK